ncbi:MAG: cyclodeaminase/cyclohydrolase family protein [Lachnospiraceae bacterium]|jgi:formiminotetrahydrofolate cyclodeaminase|nr:cyclodeaminase/cyclohydrolase family protein [Lachnospiraceae bacterium]
MSLYELECDKFTEVLASGDPVPGGGGASAMVGALGVALGSMVANLTVGKKKYADVEEEIKGLRTKAGDLQRQLLVLIQKDADNFEPLAKAYGMPKETEEQKQAKAQVMEKALKDACSVPLEIMKLCCQAIDLHEDFAHKGSSLAVSDAGVGVEFCKAALRGASLNVFINTKLMTDRAYAEETNKHANDMLSKYVKKADEIFDYVLGFLKEK